ncbi:putative T7SS-secreted protein [Kitasatospora sp. NPDC054939]
MSDQNWPGLGFCPAPGDPGAIARMYADVDSVARELEELRHALAAVGTAGGGWEGEAAEKFAKRLGELPKYLDQGHRSMAACSLALKTWHTQLAGMVTAGGAMESEAVELRGRVAQADAEAADLGRAVTAYGRPDAQAPAGALERAQARFEAAQDAGARSRRQLEEVVARARRQLEDHRQKAEAAARAVLEAAENHPPDPSVFKRLLDGAKQAWEGSLDFLVEHADLLSRVSAGLAIAALSISWIPVVGQAGAAVLGGAAMLTSAGALIGHGVGKSRGKDVSWLDIGVDTLGVIPGVGAIKGFATAGRTAPKVYGAGAVNKLVKAPAMNLAAPVRLSRGAGLGERTRAAGSGLFEMTANPLSTKGINAGLRRFGYEGVDPRNITLPVKAFTLELALAKDAAERSEQASPTAPAAAVRPSASPFLRAVA